MNRRNAIRLLLLGSASIMPLISFKWLEKTREEGLAYLNSCEALLAELAETIIPETDTPGAKAVKAEKFILRMLADCTDEKSLSNFIAGLQELEAFSHAIYKRSFTGCSPGQRELILKNFEDKALSFRGAIGKIERKLFGLPFFTTLREYTVIGFCTSRQGATLALNYEHVPGSFANLASVGSSRKSWATK